MTVNVQVLSLFHTQTFVAVLTDRGNSVNRSIIALYFLYSAPPILCR